MKNLKYFWKKIGPLLRFLISALLEEPKVYRFCEESGTYLESKLREREASKLKPPRIF